MNQNKSAEIEELRAKLAQLEKERETDLKAELLSLPAKYGFPSMDKFTRACWRAQPGKAPRMTKEVRDRIEELLSKKVVLLDIAKDSKFSLSTIQKIKNEMVSSGRLVR